MKGCNMNFFDELREFYRLMGDWNFWHLPDHQRHGALEGLWYAHQLSGIKDTYIQAATIEYERRESLMFEYGKI